MTRNQPGNESRITGPGIVAELIRHMEQGQFEMKFSVLLPCVFSVYLHPDDHRHLAGVLDLIADDARKALRTRVTELNAKPKRTLLGRSNGQQKEYRIAARDWVIAFFPDTEGNVPQGAMEIHSELNEPQAPGFRGVETTRIDKVTGPIDGATQPIRPPTIGSETRRSPERVYAEIRYEDDSGPQLYLVTQNVVRIGRGGDDLLMDLPLYTNDEISREHLMVRRDPATGRFLISDKSTNGTWLDGRRLRRGVEEPLPERAEIGLAEVLTLTFEVKK